MSETKLSYAHAQIGQSSDTTTVRAKILLKVYRLLRFPAWQYLATKASDKQETTLKCRLIISSAILQFHCFAKCCVCGVLKKPCMPNITLATRWGVRYIFALDKNQFRRHFLNAFKARTMYLATIGPMATILQREVPFGNYSQNFTVGKLAPMVEWQGRKIFLTLKPSFLAAQFWLGLSP